MNALRGAEFAGAMMEMLPPAGVPELATKADLAVLESKFDSFKAEIGGRIEAQTVRFIRWSAAIAAVSLTIAELLGRVG